LCGLLACVAGGFGVGAFCCLFFKIMV
jgi:hypothetical protein